MKPISESTWFVAASGDCDKPKKGSFIVDFKPLPICIRMKSYVLYINL